MRGAAVLAMISRPLSEVADARTVRSPDGGARCARPTAAACRLAWDKAQEPQVPPQGRNLLAQGGGAPPQGGGPPGANPGASGGSSAPGQPQQQQQQPQILQTPPDLAQAYLALSGRDQASNQFYSGLGLLAAGMYPGRNPKASMQWAQSMQQDPNSMFNSLVQIHGMQQQQASLDAFNRSIPDMMKQTGLTADEIRANPQAATELMGKIAATNAGISSDPTVQEMNRAKGVYMAQEIGITTIPANPAHSRQIQVSRCNTRPTPTPTSPSSALLLTTKSTRQARLAKSIQRLRRRKQTLNGSQRTRTRSSKQSRIPTCHLT